MSRRSLVYLSVVQEYNPEQIIDTLNKFKNVQRENSIITTFDGRQICRVDVSHVYYNFGFSKFCKKIVGEIENYFTPLAYRLKVKRGVQELKLVGGEVTINGEVYHKMIAIVNSTNKQRALSMNIGLIRKESGSSSVQAYFRNKHYKSSMPDKIKSFADNLINFNMDIEYQVKTIEDLANLNVSFEKLCQNLMFKDGEKIKSMVYRVRAFMKKLEEYNSEKYFISTEDFEVNAYDAYKVYLELFAEYDSAVIARETRRILEALGKEQAVEEDEPCV